MSAAVSEQRPLVIALAGSPSPDSSSTSAASVALDLISASDLEARIIEIRDLPAADLVRGHATCADTLDAIDLINRAQGVVVATPIYKAAYSGLLKTFLDLLPQDAFADKAVLPISTAGSLAHFLSLDFTLKPVLTALGASSINSGVYLLDDAFTTGTDSQKACRSLGADGMARLEHAVAGFCRSMTEGRVGP